MSSNNLSVLTDVLSGRDDTTALIVGSGGPSYTRAQVHNMAIAFAVALRKSGIKPGDLVTIAEPNTVEFIVAFMGVCYARAVAAPLNQKYRKDEFAFYMEDAQSKLLVTGPSGNEAAEAAGIAPAVSIQVTAGANGPSLTFTSRSDTLTFPEADLQQNATLEDPPQPDDVALFLHTSGTTSRPKGVPLTHANLVASFANIMATYEFTTEDVSLLVMPLFHVHGLMAGLLSPLAAGAQVVLPAAGGFSASTFWQDASQYKVTFYTAVPTMHQILVSRAATDYPHDNPPPLRIIRSCSSSLAPATLKAVEEAFKAPVLEAYAMTEASHQMTSNPLPKHGPAKPGSVGRPQGSVQLTILDGQCNELPIGETGEVCIKGPNVTLGYKDNPKANEEGFAGGWFHTGDQGYLDADGYLTLTGRLKELINRGGEKISPIEVDGALLSHPLVAEAVSFAAPDEKYGEVVAAAVVLKPEGTAAVQADGEAAVIKSIQDHCNQRLSSFKVPGQMFITDSLPKNATGKIQRRFMVDAFINKQPSTNSTSSSRQVALALNPELPTDGNFMAARALAALGVTAIYGVIGIPVTQLASAAQACGIRFISCHNEQAAGYAAAAAGFITGTPGVCLTVSGPGVVHGLAGISNAMINCWPMIMISGSCEVDEVGKGAFQELNQLEAVQQYVKLSVQPTRPEGIPSAIADALQAAVSGRPGAAYVDIPSNVLMASADGNKALEALTALKGSLIHQPKSAPSSSDISAVVEALKGASRPLIVIGKGAAFSQSDESLRRLVKATGIPFLSTAMGRGVVPDDDPLCANAARSLVLAQSDVAVIFGARLNWQLHFGEPPKWSETVKFILIDPEPSIRDTSQAFMTVKADAGAVADALSSSGGINPSAYAAWTSTITNKVDTAREKLSARLATTAYPLNYSTALRVIRDAINTLSPPPVVVAEGANTMDQARVLLEPVTASRCRLDAGTWGTMGVGLGYAIAAAVSRPDRQVVAVQGDSAFGFGGMELETLCRYQLPVTVIVFNNGGIYGGDRRTDALRELASRGLKEVGLESDPIPTAFVPDAKYDVMISAFGGDGYTVTTAEELASVLQQTLANKKPALINLIIDPMAGVESGNVHAFNAPKKN